jgi:hypothetical protein
LAQDLKLPPRAQFETLTQPWVETSDPEEDQRLLDHLTALARPTLTSGHFDATVPAFPAGVASSINLIRLPLYTRTRNCLSKKGLLSADALQGLSLEELLAIPGFGVKSLVDLLTAVEAANRNSERGAAPTSSFGVLPEWGAATLSARLTREARLLANEPWAKEVSLYDVRLGAQLLKDETLFREVRQAIFARRIPLEQQLCLQAPRRDIDLLRCPLLTHTKNRLSEAKLTTLSAVASLTLHEVVNLRGLGEGALADLLTVIDVCRFPASVVGPAGRDPTLADFGKGVVKRTGEARFPERLASRIHQTRALGIRCRSLPLEEELHALAVSAVRSHPEAAIQHLGWDGRGPRTLEAVGKGLGLTRERVRQVIEDLTNRLSAVPAWTPILCQALDVCNQMCPRPTEEIAALLQQKKLATALFHPYGLLTAARVLGLTHTLSLWPFGGTNWLAQASDEELLRKTWELARSAVAARGVCSLSELQAALVEQMGGGMAEDALRGWFNQLSDICWLDRDRQWFRFRTESSLLASKARKILAVAPQIQLGELWEGLMRRHRVSERSAPPAMVLRQLFKQFGLQVTRDTVRSQEPIRPQDVLSQVELIFFDILHAEGPLLATSELEKRCLQRGMNRHTFWTYLANCPILAQYATGVFGLRGAQVTPDEAGTLRQRRPPSQVLKDFGWKNDVAWIAYTVTENFLRVGVATLPAGVRDALGDGLWPLLTADRIRVGTLVCRGGYVWGLEPFFYRGGTRVGDTLVIEIDRRAATATIRVRDPEPLEQANRDLPVTSHSVDKPD